MQTTVLWSKVCTLGVFLGVLVPTVKLHGNPSQAIIHGATLSSEFQAHLRVDQQHHFITNATFVL